MRETHTAQRSIFDFYSQHERSLFFKALSDVIDAHPQILNPIGSDLLNKGAKSTGRKGLSVESVFRCMLIKQITQVDYRQLSFLLSDSPTYRAFARLDGNSFPSHTTLCQNIRRIQPETLQFVFETLGLSAFNEGIIDLDLMRLDSTVTKSHIHDPSDSQLLDDGIRVLSRLFAKSGELTGVKLRLTDYRKKSRQLAAAIFYAKQPEKDAKYGELIPLAKRVIEQSERAVTQVELKGTNALGTASWMKEVKHYRDLLNHVIFQTERRVFNGEKVPASEKIVSLFEPHTDIIIKSNRGIEYGHKLNLSTDKHGFITTVMIEEGNPSDSERFIPLLEEHQRIYGCVPTTTIADGCYATQSNIDSAKTMDVEKVAFHKKNGMTLKAMGIKEKTLKKLRNFRAGIEGNISELKRAFGAGKAQWKGESGFMSFVWASVISYNLVRLTRFNSG